MKKRTRIFISGVIITMLAGCSSPTTPASYGNLITNSSFEINGEPSLQGWVASDSSLVHFSTSVPPGGGAYSVEVKPGIDPIEGAVYTTIGALAGTHVYHCNVWAKTAQWAGDVYIDLLKLNPPGSPVLMMTPVMSDTAWTQYSIYDTITANTGDSITVGLEAGSGNSPGSKMYFDLCTFTPVN